MADIENGENLGSVRAKLNQMRSELDAAGAFMQPYATRADAVTALGSLSPAVDRLAWLESDGRVVEIVKESGATDITDFPGWVPSHPVRPEHHKANTTPGTTAMDAAIQNALSYLQRIGGGKLLCDASAYLLESASDIPSNVKIEIPERTTIKMASGNPQAFRFLGSNSHIPGAGTIEGNGETFDYLVTSGGITDGDATGTADAAASGTSLTINDLGTGWIKKGDRIEWVDGGTVYARIVTADAEIVSGSVTVTVDAAFSPAITLGQSIFVKQPGNRLYVDSATAGDTTLTLRVADINSGSGGYMRAGDQFSLYTNDNDLDDANIDFATVFEVASDVAFTGSYPNYVATVTLTDPIPADITLDGTLTTSIQDHRNNVWTCILGWGSKNCSVSGLTFKNMPLHAVMANATIRSPYNGGAPEDNRNVNFQMRDLHYVSGGDGAAFGGAKAESVFATGCTGEGGSSTLLHQFEGCKTSTADDFRAKDMQTAAMVTGSGEDYFLSGVAENCAVGADLRNAVYRGSIDVNVEMGASSVLGLRVVGGSTVTGTAIVNGAGAAGSDHVFLRSFDGEGPDEVALQIISKDATQYGIIAIAGDNITLMPGSSITGAGARDVSFEDVTNIGLAGVSGDGLDFSGTCTIRSHHGMRFGTITNLPSLLYTPNYRANVSGTVDAIELTTGQSISGLVEGEQVRFRATGPNTGGTTINLDGTGAVWCRTITGVGLPAGYIRDDLDTVATYDGTNWIVEREVEKGSNANGRWTRWADGSQSCTHSFAADGSGPKTWTYPMAFKNTANLAVQVTAVGTSGNARIGCIDGNPTATSADVSNMTHTNVNDIKPVHLTADGEWY